MEENYNLVDQPQRSLNSSMKDMVRKEVIKLLEVGMIYLILYSEWVSLVQIVPKKGGMTIIQNEHKELIQRGLSQGGECALITES